MRRNSSFTRKLSVASFLALLALVLATTCTNSAVAQTERILHRFGGKGDGRYPAPLAFDSAGNITGVTLLGGGYNGQSAVVFKLVPEGDNWRETLPYLFHNQNFPSAVAFDTSGAFFCAVGYSSPQIFELVPGPSALWESTRIAGFHRVSTNSAGGLIFDEAGNLYVTVYAGGMNETGSIVRLDRSDSGLWKAEQLYEFGPPGSGDGEFPISLIRDTAGNLYGTTFEGGKNGTVFELSPNGSGGWAETILYDFPESTTGAFPISNLVRDASGNLYVSTLYGSQGRTGAVFEISPQPDGTWTATVLYTFTGGADGSEPLGLILYPDGDLYGTAYAGGSALSGTVFNLHPTGTDWTETVIHNFTGGDDGSSPTGNLILDNAGNIYGTTSTGGGRGNCNSDGKWDCGVVFEITP